MLRPRSLGKRYGDRASKRLIASGSVRRALGALEARGSVARSLAYIGLVLGTVRVVTGEDACWLALRLPEVVEIDHHDRRAFRVAGKHLATLWDATHMNVMLDEPGIRTAVDADPDCCTETWWGQRLAAVRVDLEKASVDRLSELLADAWEGKTQRPLDRLGRSGDGPDLS